MKISRSNKNLVVTTSCSDIDYISYFINIILLTSSYIKFQKYADYVFSVYDFFYTSLK